MLSESFMSKVIRDFVTGCIEWTAALNHGGYGIFGFDGETHRAHRLVYRELVDEIPEGFVVDHSCSNRACVNPDHLEAITQEENVRRGRSCKKGRCDHE